tara:strand:- start:2249 stop:2485 length:237 start_codon:yes stop_codon:yes gene_type:complete
VHHVIVNKQALWTTYLGKGHYQIKLFKLFSFGIVFQKDDYSRYLTILLGLGKQRLSIIIERIHRDEENSKTKSIRASA